MSAGHNYIGTEHLLLGLLREGEGVAARVLENLGADPSNIRTQVGVPSHHSCLPNWKSDLMIRRGENDLGNMCFKTDSLMKHAGV
jgi:ATP-dependent Clp protease ATP-binding subunit ClpA